MTSEEYTRIERQFESLAELFETKLKASEDVICGRVAGIEKAMASTKVKVDNHMEWHNTLNSRIVGLVVKYTCLILVITILVVFVLGVKEGVIPAVIAKVVG